MSTDKDPGALYSPTDFLLEVANIISASGTTIDIRKIYIKLNFEEDLFENCTSGSIILEDSNNLINTIPLIGFEYLHVELKKTGLSEMYSKTFRIYKLSNREKINAQTERYVLHFCSEEMVLNTSCLISRSYQDRAIHEIVQDIARTYLKIQPINFPQSQNTPTTGKHSIVIPNWHPFYAINWLCRLAKTSGFESPSYVFFEDRAGFHFTSLEKLSQRPPVQTFKIAPRNLGSNSSKESSDEDSSMETPYSVHQPFAFDSLQNMSRGMYSGSLITVDPILRRIRNINLTSSAFFAKTKHLNKHNLVSDLESRRDMTQEEETGAFKNFCVSTLDHDRLGYGGSAGNTAPNNVEQWGIQRSMYLSSLHSSHVRLTVPGDVRLTPGQVVEAKFPAHVLQDGAERTMDELHSGKYFISKIHHVVQEGAHVAFLDLTKDSSAVKYPQAINDNAGMDKLTRGTLAQASKKWA